MIIASNGTNIHAEYVIPYNKITKNECKKSMPLGIDLLSKKDMKKVIHKNQVNVIIKAIKQA